MSSYILNGILASTKYDNLFNPRYSKIFINHNEPENVFKLPLVDMQYSSLPTHQKVVDWKAKIHILF